MSKMAGKVSKAILGEKLGMTQVFRDDGTAVPVTVVRAGPCVVTQLKIKERDGYEAVQLGFIEVKAERASMPARGHFQKANCPPQRFVAEVPLSPQEYKLGKKIKVSIFSPGDRADVTGVSKGKGFAGVIKRWGFHGGPASHGSHLHRAPGSIGACATPSRVFKGRKMPGRMGGGRVTVQNLEVVDVDTERDLLLVKGAIPGPRGSLVMIEETVKSRKGSG